MKARYLPLFLILLVVLLSTTACGKHESTPFLGQDVLLNFEYEGITYRNAGQTVAKSEVSATAALPDNISFLARVNYDSSDYDVYSIKGIDAKQAIAIRFILCGDKACSYWYFKFTAN